jgi:hypothetical protein
VRSNAQIARDILELTFQLESGRPLRQFSRFEGPVGVALRGDVPPLAGVDLDRLISRLRQEAGIDIARVDATGVDAAQIVVEFLPLARMQRAVPKAACFVVPGIDGWRAFARLRPHNAPDWDAQPRRTKVAIFIPSDAPPQEVRDCLHEEIAQALGPLNDSYRLTDSVFNDDNFHAVLTGFDMLVLRTLYDPALRGGMTRRDVADRLPRVLARLNPGHGSAAPAPPIETPRPWIEAIETALGAETRPAARRAAIARAIEIARDLGWRDGRMAFALYVRGRLSETRDPRAAAEDLAAAGTLYAALPDAAIHRAQIDFQLAALALGADRPELASQLATRALPGALQGEQAALAAALLAFQSEAMARQGRGAEAEALRLDSIFWAGYGFGAVPVPAGMGGLKRAEQTGS